MTNAHSHDSLTNDLNAVDVLEHGWRYFALHAAQRLTLFNYFIAVSGLTIAATAATLQGTQRFSILGVALGLLLCLLALIFYKLDHRTSILIKASEAALANTEQLCVPVGSRLFSKDIDGNNFDHRTLDRGEWTYGRSFRLSFAIIGIIGLALATLSLLRASDVVKWEVDVSAESKKTASTVLSKSPIPNNIVSNTSEVVVPADDVVRKLR